MFLSFSNVNAQKPSFNFRQFKNWAISSRWLVILAALYFTTILNLSLWRYLIDHIELTGFKMVIFAFSFPVVIFCAMTFFFSLITLPYVTKPLLIILTISSSATNYLMFNLGIVIDADMIRNVMETNVREASDLITANAIIWVLITGIIPAIGIGITKINYSPWLQELKSRSITIALSAVIVGLIAGAFYKEYATFGRNNKPLLKLINTTNYLHAIFRYYRIVAMADQTFTILDEDAQLLPYPDTTPTVLILVLGETARADHFSLNGYKHNTNPELSKENIISFKNVLSCGTATNISVPCMFSDITRKDFSSRDQVQNRENLLDLLQRAGYDIIWLENDDGCKGVCKRVQTENLFKSNHPKYCSSDGSCYDEILLDGLEQRIANLKKNSVIVLHTIGSHGPTYYKRYPDTFRKFTPTCDTADLQKCSQEEIINTYDNTILYTDYIVANAIKTLKKFPKLESGLIYISDHGESLGENNIYLHGMPYSIAPQSQKHVPMVFWMSDRMKKQDHLDFKCIEKKAEENNFSHDNLFSTLLALLEVNSTTYNKSLDILDSCRTEPLPTKTTQNKS